MRVGENGLDTNKKWTSGVGNGIVSLLCSLTAFGCVAYMFVKWTARPWLPSLAFALAGGVIGALGEDKDTHYIIAKVGKWVGSIFFCLDIIFGGLLVVGMLLEWIANK